MIKIYAPASIGNINVGFDILGAALSPIDDTMLGDCITIKSAKKNKLTNIGNFAHELPIEHNNNIVWKCYIKFTKYVKKIKPISIILEKNMPVGSGLGSSACSIVASLVALNIFFKKPLNKKKLLFMMGELEGEISGGVHYDNVAPSYLGGVQIILELNKNIISQKIPHFNNWLWVIAWPGIKVSTASARHILPKTENRSIFIKQNRYLAGFIHACYTQQEKIAIKMMKDIIVEPYREKLIPGFKKVKKELKKIGAIVCGISGSGPTIFSICRNIKIAKKISNWLKNNYLINNNGFVHICKLDFNGARKLK
ncbi:homoserine kinase [Buchnera aphidicola (Taiwanaphis decaspermi)]|uniref:homoserine kinase n=1 Tax=Buchnera aphidicola TaxID=9 RepID=UPI0031B82D6E